MLEQLLRTALNRLLAQQSWARQRLMAHAGQTALVAVGSVQVRWRVDDQGYVAGAPGDSPVDVSITLPAAALTGDLANLTQQAQISGNAGFAETLSLLLRHLRPDLGGALSPLLGDVLAHRAEQGLFDLGAQALQTLRSVGGSLAEYTREEQTLLLTHSALTPAQQALEQLDATLSRLEQRVAALERQAVTKV